MDAVRKDERFAHIAKDPRFHKMRRKDRKVKIDSRFKSMFDDKRFKLKYTVDKRGRPIHATTNENLRKYYDLSDSDESDDEGDSEKVTKQKGRKELSKDQKSKTTKSTPPAEDSDSDNSAGDEEESEESEHENNIDVTTGPDIARGEGDLSTSSEDDDDDDDDSENEEDEEVIPWGELDHDAPEAEEVSQRLAVCNMDWDRIKAQDLMMTLNSFTPPGGVIRSVTIYPSEYGLARMKEEQTKGPAELVNSKDDKKAKNNDREYHTEKLRKYQLNRLRYYYAVVECDSSATASKIYEECDGIEYEGSSSSFDLRYIPDDMSFEGQEIKSQVFDVPDASTYKPTLFMNSALQQSTVNLTWDETDRDRVALTKRAFSKDDVENLDVEAYLASDSDGAEDPYSGLVQDADFGPVSEEDESEESQIQKYRSLLQGIQDSESGQGKDKDQDMDMEISWEPGLKETSQSSKKKDDQTPWEQYLEKKKDKRKKKKATKKQAEKVSDPEDSDADEEGISDDDLPDDVDLNDPYFKQELDMMADEEKPMTNKKKKSKQTSSTSDKMKEDEEDKKQKAELSLLLMDDEADNKKHFSLKSIMEDEKPLKGKKKRRNRKALMREKMAEKASKEQDGFKLDVQDPRFRDLYQNPLYNIDPTAPEFKKTKAMESLIDEKLQRRKNKRKGDKAVDAKHQPPAKAPRGPSTVDGEGTSSKRSLADPALASLIKSVKAKTKSAQDKKQKNKRAV